MKNKKNSSSSAENRLREENRQLRTKIAQLEIQLRAVESNGRELFIGFKLLHQQYEKLKLANSLGAAAMLDYAKAFQN